MKKHLIFLLCAAILLPIADGCVKSEIKEINERVTTLENRMTVVETLIDAVNKHLYINSCKRDGDGYVITISDGTVINILDEDMLFDSISVSETQVLFLLTDGTSLSIPLYSSLSVNIDAEGPIMVTPSSEIEVKYTVASSFDDISVETLTSGTVSAEVIGKGKKGVIRIKTGDTITAQDKVLVFFSNTDKIILKSITFEEAAIRFSNEDSAEIPIEGGEAELMFLSNVEFSVSTEPDCKWLSVISTKAMAEHSIKVVAEVNNGPVRSTKVSVSSRAGTIVYSIKQDGISNVLSYETEGELAVSPVYHGTNLSGTVDWGDGSTSDLRQEETHSYNAEGKHTVTVTTGNFDFVEFQHMENIAVIDFSRL